MAPAPPPPLAIAIVPCPCCHGSGTVVHVIAVHDTETGRAVPVALAADGRLWKQLPDHRETPGR
jgi:hypothetical protein